MIHAGSSGEIMAIKVIKDSENNIGWLHKSLIKGDRYILVNSKSQKIKGTSTQPKGIGEKMKGRLMINNNTPMTK